MKQRNLISYCLLLIVLIAGLSTCKKSQPLKMIQLSGGWFQQSTGGQAVRSVFFGTDGSFEATFGTYNDATPGINTRIMYLGTFTTDGNKLHVKVDTMSVQENGGTPVVTPTTQKLYENATFSATATELTLDYDTFPADAPVRTQTKFIPAMQD